MIKLNTEQELLVRCVRMQCYPGAAAGACTEELLHTGIRWDYFLSLTTQNRITPLVYKSLLGLPPGCVPIDTLYQLGTLTRQTAAQNILQLNRLKELLRVCKQAGIRAIPFKGASLARCYTNLGLREGSDIDILIRKETVHAVQQILFNQGFVGARQPGNHRLEDHLRWSHSFSYIHPQEAILVDVHWALADRKDGVYFPMEPFWQRCSTRLFFNQRIWLPDPADALLALCIHHGVRSGWNQLRYVCDLAMMLKTADELNWETVMRSAEKTGISRALLLGLALAEELLGMPLPPELHSPLARQVSINRLKRYVCGEMWNKSDKASRHFYSLAGNIRMRENLGTRFYLYGQLGMDIMRFVVKEKMPAFFRRN